MRKDYSETKMAIFNREIYDDCAQIVDIFGQGCNYPTKQGVDGFQVDFLIQLENTEGDKTTFTIIFQSDDRADNLKGYNGFEMSTAKRLGCDCDESSAAIEFMDYEQNWLDELCDIAELECKNWFDENIIG